MTLLSYHLSSLSLIALEALWLLVQIYTFDATKLYQINP